MEDNDDFVVWEKADKPLGYPPSGLLRKNLENLYKSITGSLDIGDFETFLKEVADLTYDEAKNKMILEYGTPKDLSAARMKAKSERAEAELEMAEEQARAEQRTLEEEFTEIEAVARRALAENIELFKRNEELQKEVNRLKEELIKVKAVPAPPPAAPVAKAVPAEHGGMYLEFRKRINEAISIADMNDLANEIYEILEKEEYQYLTKADATELLEDLRRMSERRAMKLAELKLPEIKRKPEKPKPEELRVRIEGQPFMGTLPPHVMYRYQRPDMETAVFQDIPFVRDHELERTIIRNGLLLFPLQWYALPPEEKVSRFGWDLASAMQHAVTALHKFSWEDLVRDYGIPEKYIEAWKKVAS